MKQEEKELVELIRHTLEYVCGFLGQTDIPDNGYYKETIEGLCRSLERKRKWIDNESERRDKIIKKS